MRLGFDVWILILWESLLACVLRRDGECIVIVCKVYRRVFVLGRYFNFFNFGFIVIGCVFRFFFFEGKIK